MVNTKRFLASKRVPRSKTTFTRPLGAGNFDNMDDFNIVNFINVKTGTCDLDPTSGKHIINRSYVDDNFLKLDTTNDPLTGDLQINKTVPALELKHSTNSDYPIISSNSSNGIDFTWNGGGLMYRFGSGGTMTLFGDNNTNDEEYVPMVLHGTDATPPTASNFPKGTIYIQYTA